MPSLQDLPIIVASPHDSLSPASEFAPDSGSEAPYQLRHKPHKPLESALLNPDFIEPVQIAVDEDARYQAIYDDFLETGRVHPLAAENESLSLTQSRFSPSPASSSGPSPAGSSLDLARGSSPEKRGDYIDSHVTLSSSNRTLTVKHWLVAHPTLVIPLSNIRYLRPARDVVPSAGVCAWGVGRSDVGWARDGERQSAAGKAFQRSWVCCFDEWGDEFVAGFTVDEPEGFALEAELLKPGVTTVPTDDEIGEI